MGSWPFQIWHTPDKLVGPANQLLIISKKVERFLDQVHEFVLKFLKGFEFGDEIFPQYYYTSGQKLT